MPYLLIAALSVVAGLQYLALRAIAAKVTRLETFAGMQILGLVDADLATRATKAVLTPKGDA
jgi:hypothetical protein